MPDQHLPINAILADVLASLRQQHRVVVQAPPGAGKTTAIPIALLNSNWLPGRIILIQPRRLAAFAAANRMASMLAEPVGQTIGYRTRHDSAVSKATRVEVVTDGIFLRWIQNDPALEGVSAVLFDEFHERTVAMDLSLAFAVESQLALRESADPLYLLVMSATLDGRQFSEWLEAPFHESAGRLFPVEVRHRPSASRIPVGQHVSQVILQALAADPGDALVFLPGFREINQVRRTLLESLPSATVLHSLHASLPQSEQLAALRPAPAGQRKVVLSTNIAETSVTIEGIRIVVDSGLARVSRYDERRGLDTLETRKISLASARQREGRAGRMAPGVCYRLWSKADEATMSLFDEPDILTSDLVPVALELAKWGLTAFDEFSLPSQPKPVAWQAARGILHDLGAIEADGRLTPQGSRLADLGMHPRLGQLLLSHRDDELASAALACAALLSEGDPLRFPGEAPHSDIRLRLALWQRSPSFGVLQRSTWQSLQKIIKQLARRTSIEWAPQSTDLEGIAEALAQTWPDRVAQLRENSATRYRMADGRGVRLHNEDSLAGSAYLVVLDTSGQAGGSLGNGRHGESQARELTIALACALSKRQLESALAPLFVRREHIAWNRQRQTVEVESQQTLGELVISAQPMQRPWPLAVASEVKQQLLRQLAVENCAQLPWNEATRQLRARLQWLHQQHPEQWPDMSDRALLQSPEVLDEWLGPDLDQASGFASLGQIDLASALKRRLDWSQWTLVDQIAPASMALDNGQVVALDFSEERGPVMRVRLQALFGLKQHPRLPNGAPVLVELLSPAQRPLQLTSDLPGFWSGSYREVAKEMRGRYPKHPWPDDPANAPPTTRAKPRR
ncbi:MAG: ATP-dependent helicase HrpB [unclassified Hahellaceae]|nr:ATP-dependent helicase HrpB [Hahellaceae bacterium]|tara:strand:+ start:16138 stop:18699 length:2562 start_codon:yes stop_codon:yes gene_type:complete